MERQRASQLHGLSPAESARQTLPEDADDATQVSGAHEVEGSLSDIDSAEFDSIRSSLKRIHGASYGQCIAFRVRGRGPAAVPLCQPGSGHKHRGSFEPARA
jgi:hypothetical protein